VLGEKLCEGVDVGDLDCDAVTELVLEGEAVELIDPEPVCDSVTESVCVGVTL